MNKPATYLVAQIMRKTMPSHDARHSTYKLYQNMIRKSGTCSFSRNAMPSVNQGCWNTMPSTRPTTRQGWTKIVQSTTNLSVRVANWQCQIPISSVTRTWCRTPTNPQAATTRCQVFYLQDMSVTSMSKSITNVPCGPGQCNGLWQKANNSIDQSTMLDTSRGGHSTAPGIRSTECQSCTNEWIFDAPEQAGRCQAPIIVVACSACQSTPS